MSEKITNIIDVDNFYNNDNNLENMINKQIEKNIKNKEVFSDFEMNDFLK